MKKYLKKSLSLVLAGWLAVSALPAAFAIEPSETQPRNAQAVNQGEEVYQIAPDAETNVNLHKENLLKIAFVDSGRKYFSLANLKEFIDVAAEGNYNAVELAIGNDGLRLLLDDMTITANDTTYKSEDVKDAIMKGNNAYYNDPNGNALTESEMDEIIAYANSKGIQIIPLLDTPGHMDAIISAMQTLGFTDVVYHPDGYPASKTTINLNNEKVVAFTKAFVKKYIDYFKMMGSEYFNLGADEFANDIGTMGIDLVYKNKAEYQKLADYINSLATMITKSGMKPMAFNDCIYYSGDTSVAFNKDIIVNYWSSGWSGYSLAQPPVFVQQGHELINLNGDYYWVMGKNKCTPEQAAKFDIEHFATGQQNQPDPKGITGAMFAIWCDEPDESTDTEVIDLAADAVKAFGGALPATENKPILADTSKLKEKIELAKSMKTDAFMPNTVDALREGVEKAQALLDRIAGFQPISQKEVNKEVVALDDAIRGLRKDNPLKITFVDAGRKYFSPSSLKTIIDSAAEGNFNAVEIGFGNDGLRFLLDDMSITVAGNTYESQSVKNAIMEGNAAYYNDPNGNALTESEMDEIIAYANNKGIQIIPLLDTPGHMDAIVHAIEKLGFTKVAYDPTQKYPGPTDEYPHDEFVPSRRTINLDNEEVVAFTKALIQKYIDYFEEKGSQYFNLGADEFANDITNEMGIHVLARDPADYAKLVKYINDVAAMIKESGMRPMAFNDCMYYNNNTNVKFDQDIMVSYWSSGWWHYYLAAPQTFVDQGHELINLNGAYYWILGKDKDKCSPEKAATFNINKFNSAEHPDPNAVAGAMFAIWCDVPEEMSDTDVAAQTAATIKAFGESLMVSKPGGSGGDSTTDKDTVINQNGDKITTETKADGTVIQTTVTANGDKIVKETKKDGSSTITYNTVTGITGTVHTNNNGNMIDAVVKVSSQAVKQAESKDGVVHLPVKGEVASDKNAAASIRVEVPVGGAKVEIPVDQLTSGTVAIVVHEDGTEEVVKHTGLTEDGVVLDLAANTTFKLVDNSKHFQDVHTNDWFSNSVDFISARELMQGTSDTVFSPKKPLSRGMLAVILYNLENRPAVSQDNKFNDVPADSWFTDAVLWAAEKDILSGYGDGKVGPNNSITREQLATMLYRYAGSPETNHQLSGFADGNMTSQFAQTAMAWAVETGVMSGKGNGKLDPKGQATRAEVAQMIMNFMN